MRAQLLISYPSKPADARRRDASSHIAASTSSSHGANSPRESRTAIGVFGS